MACVIVLVINLTSLPFNQEDTKHLKLAVQRCHRLYNDAPCLKKFIKKGEREYQAICGGLNETQSKEKN